MAANLTPAEIIASALQLSLAEREQVFDALQESLIDDSIDHGPEEPADEVEAAWSEEIARRIADIDSGRVKTISSEEAWKIINGETPPET
jgi:putative addiction module component (TIGR02574 family)